MNKKNLVITSLFGVLLFGGCTDKYTEAPIAVNSKITEQQKIQSASQWKVISKDLTSSIIKKIGTDSKVYVKSSNDDFKFSNALQSLVITELVNQNIQVSTKEAKNNIVIDLSVKKIKFSKNRAEITTSGALLSMLSGEVWTVNSNNSEASSNYGHNWYNSKYSEGPIPQNEIIVTISAVKNNTYVANYSNIYYIADKDNILYEDDSKVTKLVGN